MKEEIDEETEFREDDMDEIITGAGLGEEDIFFEDGEGLEPILCGFKKSGITLKEKEEKEKAEEEPLL